VLGVLTGAIPVFSTRAAEKISGSSENLTFSSAEGGCAKKVVDGSHAEEKFEILRRHGFVVSKRKVSETLRRPDKVEEGFRGRKVAQRRISEKHVLRVVYEEGEKQIGVVTFYPGRRSRYESSI
jgi:hypothetical protein